MENKIIVNVNVDASKDSNHYALTNGKTFDVSRFADENSYNAVDILQGFYHSETETYVFKDKDGKYYENVVINLENKDLANEFLEFTSNLDGYNIMFVGNEQIFQMNDVKANNLEFANVKVTMFNVNCHELKSDLETTVNEIVADKIDYNVFNSYSTKANYVSAIDVNDKNSYFAAELLEAKEINANRVFVDHAYVEKFVAKNVTPEASNNNDIVANSIEADSIRIGSCCANSISCFKIDASLIDAKTINATHVDAQKVTFEEAWISDLQAIDVYGNKLNVAYSDVLNCNVENVETSNNKDDNLDEWYDDDYVTLDADPNDFDFDFRDDDGNFDGDVE